MFVSSNVCDNRILPLVAGSSLITTLNLPSPLTKQCPQINAHISYHRKTDNGQLQKVIALSGRRRQRKRGCHIVFFVL